MKLAADRYSPEIAEAFLTNQAAVQVQSARELEDVLRSLTIRVDELEEGPSVMLQKRDRDERRDDRRGERGDRGDRGDRGPRRERGPRRDEAEFADEENA